MSNRRIREGNKRILLKDWGRTLLAIAQWIFVLWLLWPLRNPSTSPIHFARVVLGVLLFIVFGGKLFYDSVIAGILRQRRTSAKQDIVTLIGIVIVLGLVVGLLILFVGFVLVEFFRSSR